jgi:hypothetical protein
VIGRGLIVGVGDILRAAFKAVLANDDGAAFAFFDILWQEQYAIGKDIAVDVEHDLITEVFLFATDQT